MTTEFKDLNLHPKLEQHDSRIGLRNNRRIFKRLVIPLMLEGKDVIAQSQTGSGKTAAFALPILQDLINGGSTGSVQALVLTPTRELAIQVSEAIAQYGRITDVRVDGDLWRTALRHI